MSFQPPPRIKNALDNRKLNLSTPCPGAQGKWSSLIWGLIANNPRLTVFTNDPNDQGDSKNYGKITANLDLPVFFMFVEMLQKVIDHEGEIKYKLENKGFTFFGGKRSEKPSVISELWFGKDKEGIVWISVTARDRPKIKFTLMPTEFHHLVTADGTPVSPSEISRMFSNGYLKILTQMMVNLAVDNYVEPPPKKDNGGGNRGGSYGGGGGAPAASAVDNDLPF